MFLLDTSTPTGCGDACRGNQLDLINHCLIAVGKLRTRQVLNKIMIHRELHEPIHINWSCFQQLTSVVQTDIVFRSFWPNSHLTRNFSIEYCRNIQELFSEFGKNYLAVIERKSKQTETCGAWMISDHIRRNRLGSHSKNNNTWSMKAAKHCEQLCKSYLIRYA